MAFLNDGGKQLLKNTLFSLKVEDNEWAIPELVGIVIGSQISLLGCTNNPESLYEVIVASRKLIAEINELRTMQTEAAINLAERTIKQRYELFFNGIPVIDEFEPISYGFSTTEAKRSLARVNTGSAVDNFLNTLQKVLLGTGYTTLVHNQPKQEATPAPQAETPAENTNA